MKYWMEVQDCEADAHNTGFSGNPKQYENYNDLREVLDTLRVKAMSTRTTVVVMIEINAEE